MGIENHPGLRGFDSYEVKLGDELRGERASKGKSLLDVQRDLKIRADYIAAIEDADAEAFPHAGFAAGYVRSYARYLELDADDVYRRFCAESGFSGVVPTDAVKPQLGRAATAGGGAPVAQGGASGPAPATSIGASKAGSTGGARPGGISAAASAAADRAVVGARFARPGSGASAREVAAGLRGLGSVAALALLVAGLGYGGWSLLQDIQRLGFAPLPTAPEVLVVAPDFAMPAEATPAAAATAEADAPRATLAAIYAAQEAPPPALAPRDGPISSIDPRRAGIYATPEAPVAVATAAATATTGTGGHVRIETPAGPILVAASGEAAAETPAAPAAEAPRGVDVLAVEEAWVRVRDGERRVLFTGILGPGERFTLPADAAEPDLRAGNAGAVYIVVDGAAYGPLGSGPQVAKNVNLRAEAVRAAYPPAPHVSAPPPPTAAASATETAAEGDVALRGD